MGTPNGFGVTLQNLFASWPREKIRYFYNRGEYIEQPKADLDFRFAPVPASPGRRFAIPKILGMAPEWRGQYSSWWLKRNLKGFSPDLVFSSVHSFQSILFGDWISQEINIPHALHIMDEPFAGFDKVQVHSVLGRTCSLMTISETMREAYQEYYGMDSEVFHNGAEASFFDLATKFNDEGPIRLRFVGNLLQLQHFHAIEDIAEAVVQFNQCSSRKMVLEIFGNEIPHGCTQPILQEGEVLFHGPIPLEQRMYTLADADVQVIPFTFAPEYFESYRLSIPTKLPENLATGIPVLLYGPRGMAATDLCIRHDLATVLHERSVAALLDFLNAFAENSNPYQEKAGKAKQFAGKYLSAEAISQRFQEHLISLAQKVA